MLKQISTLMVSVQDMNSAVGFYRDVLGLPLQVESQAWSQFDIGNGTILGLHGGGTGDARSGWLPSFAVDDIRNVREQVLGGGSTIARDFHNTPGGVTLEFTDPDGNVIGVINQGVTCSDLGVVSS